VLATKKEGTETLGFP